MMYVCVCVLVCHIAHMPCNNGIGGFHESLVAFKRPKLHTFF